MRKYICSIALGVALLTPAVALRADDHHSKMEHQWNDNENESWHRYLKEHKKKDHDWGKASKHEQTAYWKWRDQHR